jgi:polyisoprenoid-binding protein YceI
MSRKLVILLVAVPLAVIVAAVGGTWAYINLIKGDEPARLALSTSTTAAGAATTAASAGTVDGSWTVGTGSQAGYRVKEILFGQSTEAVGRTTSVTGGLSVAGVNVPTATFTVDMTSVTSNSDQRDSQFHRRIMQTSQFPRSSFTLTSPITLPSAPTVGAEVSATATGSLELHGTKKTVTFPVKAKWTGATIEVNGTIPITFADYGVDNPSAGPAKVGDTGELEFLLVLKKG